MPNVDPYGAFIKDGGVWVPLDVPEVKVAGSWVTPETIEVRNAGAWRTVWQDGPTWSAPAMMRPPSVTYESSESFGMVSSRAIDTSTSTFWMSGSNASSESATAYEGIRVSLGNPAGTNRWNSITVYCSSAYELYMGIKTSGGAWEGAIMPSPTYSGSQGAEIQHAYAQGGDQTTATRTFSLGDRTDLTNAEIQFTATKLAAVPSYSGFRMAVKDIQITYQTQV